MRRNPLKLLALLLPLVLLAGACGSDGGSDSTATTVAEEEVPTGGTLVIGAEQEPDCTDWIGTCGGSSWGYWMMNVTTLTRPFNAVKVGDAWDYKPTELLDGEPKLETEPVQKITYKLSSKVKWNDGTPVTSKDFKYTFDQITTGADIYDTTGYADIESVDASDPETVVVTFKQGKLYADWRALFGGGYGLYPAHILEGKDRNKEVASGYKFSAGPWIIESWNKGVDITLVPNTGYWGEKPKLDKVVFKILSDTSAEFQAFKAGEVSVIYPQPQPDVVSQIEAGLTGFKSKFTADTGNLEALWFHNGKAPFNDEKVRQAWGYAIDRDAVVNRLFGPLGVKTASQSLNPPILSKFSDTKAWSMYKKDLKKVDELMTSAGWKKGSDGIWEKGGQKFNAIFKSTTGNKRRELTEQILQEQLKEAGFNFTIQNQKAGDLFGDQLPKGDYDVALYAQVATSLSPSNCNTFCSKNIPQAPKFSGQNWGRVNLPAIDPLLDKVDGSLDDDERAENQKKADKLMAAANVALPLDPLPNILLWSESVVGPLEDNAVMGPFFNLHKWGLKK